MTTTTDLLASLGERDGWAAAPSGNGWQHKTLDITARQLASNRYTIEHDGHTREATSATGALCIVDQITARANG